jgi:hypothetical protein
MTKLCPRGKAAAKRKFAVYPSAYANAYASKICAGKIKDPSGVKRKDFRGPKPSKAMGGRIYKANGGDVPARLRKGGPKQHQSRIPPHRKEQMKKEFKKYGGPRPKGSVGARTFKRDGGMPGLSKDLKKLKKLGIKKPSSEMQEKLTDKNFKRKKK